ncbi:CLUMA_CG018162, isoform A [Clunio marinus]|uniref:CLUMA_CG018162, isoform A n=1 Tax=Clunio marinus TaxID=568069 RepID=A0A1J1J454_9DIPT|nr:CLUMA_CG018162, isoform A [Clunio marinus]
MSNNGGTLPPVPLQNHSQSSSSFSCSHCGLLFESATSLQVHMHYQHHETQSRWGILPSSTTPTSDGKETNNNNNHPTKHHIKAISPHQNTIAAPADSSDNNPPTPQPNDSGPSQNFQGDSGTQSPFSTTQNSMTPLSSLSNEQHRDISGYPSYYEQYYHGMDYNHITVPHHHHLLNNGQHHQLEYKTVPSTRYQQPPLHFNSTVNSTNNNSQTSSNTAVQTNNNGLSPRVVSSTTPPAQTNSTSPVQMMQIPSGQPTPSPSPKQCDKCGVVCETDGQLMEHSQVVHADIGVNGIKSQNGDHEQNFSPFTSGSHHYHHSMIKDEPPSDILDLDSQKMVYPPHPDGSLPPMHSLHPLQSMQRHPMIWSHHDAHFVPPHPGYHQTIKPEYPPTPPIKNEYMASSHMKSSVDYSTILTPTPVSMKQEYNHIKSDYNNASGIAQSGTLPPSTINSKNFVNDLTENGNQLTSSPSDFPSTTTPQENGNQFQRTFEPPTSSLPSTKGANWKSNEARRPKTYNCTACNKWFTSSGHLKRHYNTTLHKNAVKSSGQPDPATLPISAHHHPNRDPNYMGKRRSHHNRNQANQQQAQNATSVVQTVSQTQLQQQNIVSESSTRSPDYQPQFNLPSFGSSTIQQNFQQYGNTNLHNPPGNGQAGPSVYVASQPRGLHQILMSNSNLTLQTDNHQAQQHQLQLLHHQPQHQLHPISITTNFTQPQSITMQSPVTSNINNLMDPPYPLHTNTNTPSYHITITEEQNYHNTIGNLPHSSPPESIGEIDMDSDSQCQDLLYATLPSIQPGNHMTSYDQLLSRYTGGAAYTGDMAPPFSPDIPEQYHQTATVLTISASLDENQTESLTSPKQSPSIVSSTVPYSSTSSSKTISTKSSSVIAAATSSGEYRCDICDKVFNKSCYLTQHNKTFHSGDRPFKCHRCGKRFPCGASHEEHVAKHGGEKPFKCEVCPKQFNHKTDLRRHMCLHSGSKPFSCIQCSKGFIRKDHMVKHMDTHKKKLNGNSKKSKLAKKGSTSLNTPDSSESLSIQYGS